jgi:hypothetical protein
MRKNKILGIIGLITTLIITISCTGEKKVLLKDFTTGKIKLLVCPVHVLDNQKSTYDTISSLLIVDYINEKKIAKATLTKLIPPANNEWRANEAKILTISINLFTDFVKKSNLPEDTYILYPEFLRIGPGSKVIAIHYCLLNNKGEIAMRGLLNSHWEEFQKVNPTSSIDCVAVFINGFEEKMKNK